MLVDKEFPFGNRVTCLTRCNPPGLINRNENITKKRGYLYSRRVHKFSNALFDILHTSLVLSIYLLSHG